MALLIDIVLNKTAKSVFGDITNEDALYVYPHSLMKIPSESISAMHRVLYPEGLFSIDCTYNRTANTLTITKLECMAYTPDTAHYINLKQEAVITGVTGVSAGDVLVVSIDYTKGNTLTTIVNTKIQFKTMSETNHTVGQDGLILGKFSGSPLIFTATTLTNTDHKILSPMKTVNNHSLIGEGNITIGSNGLWEFIEPTIPVKYANPAKDFSLWLDTKTGVQWVCIDKTPGANVWITPPYREGAFLDGLRSIVRSQVLFAGGLINNKEIEYINVLLRSNAISFSNLITAGSNIGSAYSVGIVLFMGGTLDIETVNIDTKVDAVSFGDLLIKTSHTEAGGNLNRCMIVTTGIEYVDYSVKSNSVSFGTANKCNALLTYQDTAYLLGSPTSGVSNAQSVNIRSLGNAVDYSFEYKNRSVNVNIDQYCLVGGYISGGTASPVMNMIDIRTNTLGLLVGNLNAFDSTDRIASASSGDVAVFSCSSWGIDSVNIRRQTNALDFGNLIVNRQGLSAVGIP